MVHVQRAEAAAHRRCQRAFDADLEIAQCLEGLLGNPAAVKFVGLFARIDFHPSNGAVVAIGFLHGPIQNQPASPA